jgi:hypothetical protein
MARKTKMEDPMVALPIEEAAQIMEAVAAAGEGATVDVEPDAAPEVEVEDPADIVANGEDPELAASGEIPPDASPKFIYAKASSVAGRMTDPFSKVSFPEEEFVPTEATSWVLCQIEAGLLIKRDDAAN